MRILIIVIALGLISLLAACAGGGGGSSDSQEPAPTETTPAETQPASRTLDGTMTLDEGFTDHGSDAQEGLPCQGKGIYADIQSGTQVTVRNEADELIADARLSSGRLAESGLFGDCVFTFTVHDIPEAASYTIEVSDHGGLTYSAEELESLDWKVAFTLGD